MAQIWPETAYGGDDLLPLEFADFAGKFEQLECVFELYVKHTLVFAQRCKARFVFRLCRAYLHNRSETADFDRDRFAGSGVCAENAFADFVFGAQFVGFLDFGWKRP